MNLKAILIFIADVNGKLTVNGSQIFHKLIKSLAKPIMSRGAWL